MSTLYAILGAHPTDDPDALRRAYRKAALASHPDKHPGDPTATERFRAVRRAWLVLADESQRAAYDSLLARQQKKQQQQQQQRHPGRYEGSEGSGRSYSQPRTSDDDEDSFWEGSWEDLADAFAAQIFDDDCEDDDECY